jgi:Cu(I)/Ag(I) efflux system membrane fusion protein
MDRTGSFVLLRMTSRVFRVFNFILFLILILSVTAATSSCTKKTSHTHETQSEVKTIYYCPMHPTYTSDRPGQCPICGMTLVPMKPEEKTPEHEGMKRKAPSETTGQAAVTITAGRQQLIGVKKAVIKKQPAQKTIRTVGKVAFDPELAVAQREYIEAIRVGDKSLSQAARQRLTLMGMGEEQIKELARKRSVQRNLYLPEKTAWVYPIIYEYELPFVAIGQSVTIELPQGGGTREGIIRAIDPVIDQTTRTARLRLEVPNTDQALKPNMFINATITKDLGQKLLVPKDAVIDSGERKIVFVIHEGEQFMPHEVKLGAELSDSYIVESGLKEGDEVATAANFLIDAESKLKAALGGTGGMEGMGGHKHGE